MAVYTVPQDVEADDKLLGPFSFRQFIYLIIVALAGFLTWVFWQIFPVLAILPLPVILLFGALALPLRKDQPMETYLVAMMRFYLKPRLRLWVADGSVTLVEISAPKAVEEIRTKGLSQEAARNQLDNLAMLMDTRGWSAKGVISPTTATIDPLAVSASDTSNDVLDDNNAIAQSFDNLISREEAARRQAMMLKLEQEREAARQNAEARAAEPAPTPQTVVIAPQPTTAPPTPQPSAWDKVSRLSQPTAPDQPLPDHIDFNPYPQMHQRVVSGSHAHSPATQKPANLVTPVSPAVNPSPTQPAPVSTAPETTTAPQSREPVTPAPSPDIVKLAYTSNTSISSLATEAHRLEQKLKDQDEVVISLR